jgi:dTDP-4-dehydrorhamnose reductase
MRIYITGINGQLGRALANALGEEHELAGARHSEVDITDLPAIRAHIGACKPDAIIHAAAMTDVEGCARDPDQAYRVNALGARNVAVACQDTHSRMVLISTNEVFDGQSDRPYSEFDAPNPINPYARSKYAGEVLVRDLLSRFYIVRVAWLYGYGGANFVAKIVQRARQAGQLRVVTDEIGSPTFTQDAAHAIARLISTDAYGTYHFTNSGFCSRFEFAQRILKLSGLEHIPIEPIRMTQFQRLSTPPPYTALRNFNGAHIGVTLRPWQDALADYIAHEQL